MIQFCLLCRVREQTSHLFSFLTLLLSLALLSMIQRPSYWLFVETSLRWIVLQLISVILISYLLMNLCTFVPQFIIVVVLLIMLLLELLLPRVHVDIYSKSLYFQSVILTFTLNGVCSMLVPYLYQFMVWNAGPRCSVIFAICLPFTCVVFVLF